MVVPRRPWQGPGPGVAGGTGGREVGEGGGVEGGRESWHEPKIDPGQRAVAGICTAYCLPIWAEGGGLGQPWGGGGQAREGREQA